MNHGPQEGGGSEIEEKTNSVQGVLCRPVFVDECGIVGV